MNETLSFGDISMLVTRKDVKNVHLSVHPPDGRVTLVVPTLTRIDVANAYATSKLGWIRRQQALLRSQARETPRQFVERESHNVWGRRYLLSVVEKDAKPRVQWNHREITLYVRPGSGQEKREQAMHDWHKTLMHEAVPPLIDEWQTRLGVRASSYFLQRMKTKWGSCNSFARTIRLNTELVTKPRDLLGYVVVHELLHLLEPSHNDRFLTLLSEHYPAWREARLDLNALPLAAQNWK
jgi:predicted metal-dependent hydrolase